jgi:uncharacterized protein
MLKVDLGLLSRQHRVEVDEEIGPEDEVWNGTGLQFDGPVVLRLDVQQAGSDVVARGRVGGTAVLSCRRCTRTVLHELDEELTFLFRSGATPVEAEEEEVYALPERARELDLGGPLRESLLLSVPQYVLCEDACRGFCPRCGTNLNDASCDCTDEEDDPRWTALRRLRSE